VHIDAIVETYAIQVQQKEEEQLNSFLPLANMDPTLAELLTNYVLVFSTPSGFPP